MEACKNKSIKKYRTYILIVGAGPTGLTLACLLKKMGVPFIIIDQKSKTSDVIKSIALSSRSLEIFADLGLSEQAIQLGQKISGVSIFRNNAEALSLNYAEIPARFSFNLHLGQPHTEKLLHEYLDETVRWEHVHTDFNQDENSVYSTLLHHHCEIHVESDYLIAADGASSTIRKKCHIAFDGETYPSHYLLANVNLAWPLDHDRTRIFFNKNDFLAVHPLPNGLSQIGGKLANPVDIEKRPSESELMALFKRNTVISGQIRDISWINYYRTHCRYVKQRICNRVLFLGDAAQIISPITGLGMNAGMQDAENLAWKLKLLYQRISDPTLLKSFHDERYALSRKLASFSNVLEASVAINNTQENSLRDYLITYSQENDAAQKNNAARLMQKDLTYPLPNGKQAPCPFLKNKYLFDLIDHTKHHLFIFSNTIPTWLDTILSDQIILSWIDIIFITDQVTSLPGHCIFDEGRKIYQAFSVENNVVFLIRPDRYIAFHDTIFNQTIPDKIKQTITMVK